MMLLYDFYKHLVDILYRYVTEEGPKKQRKVPIGLVDNRLSLWTTKWLYFTLIFDIIAYFSNRWTTISDIIDFVHITSSKNAKEVIIIRIPKFLFLKKKIGTGSWWKNPKNSKKNKNSRYRYLPSVFFRAKKWVFLGFFDLKYIELAKSKRVSRTKFNSASNDAKKTKNARPVPAFWYRYQPDVLIWIFS